LRILKTRKYQPAKHEHGSFPFSITPKIRATRSHSEPCRFSQSRNRSSINKSVLNADLIAGGLSPVRPELATLAARRLSF
jgi:hypothetical protein